MPGVRLTRRASGWVALVALALTVSACSSSSGGSNVPDASGTGVGQAVPIPGLSIAAIACSQRSCLAGGQGSDPAQARLVTTTDGGSTWSRVTDPLADQLDVAALSCTADGWCLATGTTPGTGVPGALVTTNGGTTWHQGYPPSSAAPPSALDCIADQLCFATDVGQLLETTTGAATWQLVATMPATLSTVWSLACPSALRCLLAGAHLTGPSTSVGVLAAASPGNRWRLDPLPAGVGSGPATAVSCGGPMNCVAALNATGSALRSPTASASTLVSSDGGLTWSTGGSLNLNQVLSIACASTKVCSAVGTTTGSTSGAAATTADGGKSWSPIALSFAPSALLSTSCSSTTRCTAVGVQTLLTLLPA